MSDDQAIRALARCTTSYGLGLFCPAELWARASNLLSDRAAERLLDELPADLQGVLRRAYQERPWSLQNGPDEVDARRRIEDWCRRSGA